MNKRGLKKSLKNRVFGNDKLDYLGLYENYIPGKVSRLKFETTIHTTKIKLGYYVH